MSASSSNRLYKRSECCWNCKAPGHKASQCRQKRRLFCSFCLKDGVTSSSCQCRRSSRTFTERIQLATNDWRKYLECPEGRTATPVPLWIGVGDETFRTFINTAEPQTLVGWMVSTKASLAYGVRREFIRNEKGLISESLIPFRFENTIRTIRCRIVDEPSEVITFGTDALNCFGFQALLATHQCFNFIGCPPTKHPGFPSSPVSKKRDPAKLPPRTSYGPKNPINLKFSDEEDDDEPIETTTFVVNLENNPETAGTSWKDLMLHDPTDELESTPDDESMNLDDSEVDEYLNLDTDDIDVSELL